MDISKADDAEIIFEISKRFEEKNASLREMEFMTKKLLDLNERIKKTEEIKNEFLSLIRNEFNNPLSSLLNMAQILEGDPEEKSMRQAVRIINSEMLRLDFHFKNIFAASDIEAGEIANYFTNINFKSIFEDAKAMFRYNIEDKNLEVSFIESGEGRKVSDSNKIFLIMMNLLSNSIKYSYENSKITLAVKVKQDEFIITVEDFGEGIDIQYKAEVFERFSKFSSGKRKHMGLGLGLSVVRGLAEALGGTVDYESNEGWTLFKVVIPTDTEEAKIADASEDSNTTLFENFDGEF